MHFQISHKCIKVRSLFIRHPIYDKIFDRKKTYGEIALPKPHNLRIKHDVRDEQVLKNN